MAILAMLARAGERGVSRDKLLALLWPDIDGERASRTLAQAIYALRKDLGTEDAIVGGRDLHFDPAVVVTDVGELGSAASRGDAARAAELYCGPFLDGFHVSGADQFMRWVDHEREALARDHARTLESLARESLATGNARESVGWWQKLAALDPLNARVTLGLMEALAAAGDRASALTQARIYETLVEQELDLPPDREVGAFAARLRVEPEPPRAPVAAKSVEIPTTVLPSVDGVIPEPVEGFGGSVHDTFPAAPVVEGRSADRDTLGNGRRRTWRVAAVGVLAGIGVTTWLLTRAARDDARVAPGDRSAVVAIGRIASYGSDSSARAMTGPVSDLLATSLARSPGLRVVSPARMTELLRRLQRPGDTTGSALAAAAREAGATELVDGTLYARPDGALRLDLRRVDLTTGAIGDVRTIEGDDLFALVDSGTARLVASLGARTPEGSIADVTTRSLLAFRMYEQGIDAYSRHDLASAVRLFDSALAEDSAFALAAYYGAISAGESGSATYTARLERARRLAAHVPDRERLTILADWAYRVSSPALRSIAETLATKYPSEVEGPLYTGAAMVMGGDFLQARAPLERAIALDSVGSQHVALCGVCAAMQWLTSAYVLADSFPAAERTARRWLALRPNAPAAVDALVSTLELSGRPAEADSVFRAARVERLYVDAIETRAIHLMRLGDYHAADSLLVTLARQGTASAQSEGYWMLAISLREQGRLTEALEAARHLRSLAHQPGAGTLSSLTALEAQVQLERGRPALAAALFDSLQWLRNPEDVPSQRARSAVWRLVHVGNARAAAGDTASLARLADSVEALGTGSGFGRDWRLHHHLRGLLLAARGDDAGAIDELRSAIYSLTEGYTRTNFVLATLLLRNGRPRDAIAVLQPALRGPVDGSNLYVNRIELHELLARAWYAAGSRDSAAAHYDVVARAWAAGDPPFRARADSARVRAGPPRRS